VSRFWSRVNKNGSMPSHVPMIGNCWEWEDSVFSSGYGRMWFKGKSQRAHRVSFFIHNGKMVDLVMHACDNQLCVRPSHLKEGTPLLNIRDAISKGRKIPPPLHDLCALGHPYSGNNLYTSPVGKRSCRACMLIADRKRSRSRKRMEYQRLYQKAWRLGDD
jgi:hypothetical protein